MYSNSLVAPWKIGQKTNSNVWLPWNSFYRKQIPMFGCLGTRFTENQFPCLVWSNILRKMEFVLRKINSHVWFIQTFFGKWNLFYGKSIHMFGLFKHFTDNTKCLATFVEKMLARQFTHFLIGFKPTETHNIPLCTHYYSHQYKFHF